MNFTKLKIKKINNKAKIPFYATKNSSGMDLCACIEEPIEIKPLERKLISTGLSIELPPGYEAQIRPRSGLSLKHGITLVNSIGTIDADYRGEICVPIINLSNETYYIKPFDRICQMVIMKVEIVKIETAEDLTETLRGSGGFGSTGLV